MNYKEVCVVVESGKNEVYGSTKKGGIHPTYLVPRQRKGRWERAFGEEEMPLGAIGERTLDPPP